MIYKFYLFSIYIFKAAKIAVVEWSRMQPVGVEIAG